MILSGPRSPLVVDFEETLARLGMTVAAAVSVSGVPPVLDHSRLVELAKKADRHGYLEQLPVYSFGDRALTKMDQKNVAYDCLWRLWIEPI